MWRPQQYCQIVSELTKIPKTLCLSVLSNWEKRINDELLYAYGLQIIFADYSDNKIIPNMNSAFPGKILVNVAWGCQLMNVFITYDQLDISIPAINAFIQTIGHELGHHADTRLPFHFLHIKFRCYVAEVYADFYSAGMFLSNQRKQIIRAMQFKTRIIKSMYKDTGDCCHPALRKRMYDIRYYDFTKELILQIAKDCNCTDRQYINKVMLHYQGKWMNLS